MPGGDRTGPVGLGPMSGRAAGFCAGFSVPGYMNPSGGRFAGRGYGFGRGRGFGMGRGMGYRWRMTVPFYPYDTAYSEQDEAEMLKQEAKHFESCLEEIKKRLAKLEETTGHKK